MYDLYLKDVLLPVTPETIETKIKGRNKAISLISEGAVNLLKSPELTQYSFKLLLPAVKYPFARYVDGFQGVQYYLDFLEQLMVKKEPFQFIVTRSMPGGKALPTTNQTVTLEDYTLTEDAGNGMDQTVKVTLKQYKNFGTKTVAVMVSPLSQAAEGLVQAAVTITEHRASQGSPAPTAGPVSYQAHAGETVHNIALRVYGNAGKTAEIMQQNEAVLQGANVIAAPVELVLPGV